MRISFASQPNVYSELVRQAMYLSIGMGWLHVTTEQQTLILSFVSALLAVVVWTQVVPNQTITDAGHDVKTIQAQAKAANEQKP